MLYKDLNFGQALSQELLKIISSATNALRPTVFYTDILQHPPCSSNIQSMFQTRSYADAEGARDALVSRNNTSDL